MPVILPPSGYARWLDTGGEDAASVADLLAPSDPAPFQATPVSGYVNNPKHDDPRCIEPIINQLRGTGGGALPYE